MPIMKDVDGEAILGSSLFRVSDPGLSPFLVPT